MDGPDKSKRALSFGAVAEQYDAVRPGYPDALFDDLVAMLPGRRVVEIGAGTGKATGGLLDRGLDVTAVEPDPAMARVLHRRHGLDAVVARYEEWIPDGHYDGLVSAQAWHWTEPAGRYDRAARALRPGGVIALLWNIDALRSKPLLDQILAAHRAHGIGGDQVPFEPLADQPADPLGIEPGDELVAHPLFDGVEHRQYPNELTYTGDELVAFLGTTSLVQMLTADARRSFDEQLRAIVAAAPDGVVRMLRRSVLYTARRV